MCVGVGVCVSVSSSVLVVIHDQSFSHVYTHLDTQHRRKSKDRLLLLGGAAFSLPHTVKEAGRGKKKRGDSLG